MDLNYGINGSFSIAAASPITISSSTPVGMVVSADISELGMKKFNNADEALSFIKTNNITKGTFKSTVTGISLQSVNCPLVVVIVAYNEEDDIVKTDILAGISELKKSDPLTGINLANGIIIAPEYSSDTEVAAKLESVAKALFATGISDNFSDDEAGVKAFVGNISSKYMLVGHGRYRADGMLIPFSPLMAGVIAYYDANSTYGWAQNHSNRVVSGVAGCERVVEYLDGSDCEARRLRQSGVAMILKDVGWRTYGFETTDIDPIWQSLDRVRTFHRLLAAILEANKYARDREADQLIWVKKSIVEFMNELKGNGVIIGFDVFFDNEKNTKATVTAGKFYLTIKIQDMPSIRELNIELVYSDDWSDTLINYINGDE